MICRLAGVLFVLSSVVALLFQGVAIAQWSGSYTNSNYLTSDLGASVCTSIEDSFGLRYVCSPGHLECHALGLEAAHGSVEKRNFSG